MNEKARQFGEIIRKLRRQRGITIYLLAELSDIDKGHLSRIERGMRNPPKADAVNRLAQALGVPTEYLLAKAGHTHAVPGEILTDEEILQNVGSSLPPRSGAISPAYLEKLKEKHPDFSDFIEFLTGQAKRVAGTGDYRRIPIIGYITAGGPTGYAPVDSGESVMLSAAELPGDMGLFALRVKGDSMVGSRIEENDVVVISPAQKGLLKAGDIAAVRIGEEGISLKQVHNYEDGLVLRSTNPEYPDLKFDEADVAGKAIRLLKVHTL